MDTFWLAIAAIVAFATVIATVLATILAAISRNRRRDEAVARSRSRIQGSGAVPAAGISRWGNQRGHYAWGSPRGGDGGFSGGDGGGAGS